MQRHHKLYLEDIIEAICKIESYEQGKSFEQFSKNEMLCDAIIRNLEIIGEAVKNLPSEVKKKNPEVEWKKISGLRDTLFTNILA